jgi:diguanylate cyclase (GGDEF)-like protein/PAS domain S-box-containing protein
MTHLKKYFFVFIVFFLIQIIMLTIFINAKEEEISKTISQKQQHFITTYNTIFSTYSNLPKVIFQGRINNDYIASLLQSAYESDDMEYKQLIREEMYDQLIDAYSSTLASSGFKQLQFILKNGENFLNFSNLDIFGQDLKPLRYSIREIENTQKPLEGFESGPLYNGYRYIYPLFFKGKFVGSVDITLDLDTYLNLATNALGGEQRFLMKWDSIVQSSLKTNDQKYIRSCIDPSFIFQKKNNFNIFHTLSSMNKHEKEFVQQQLKGSQAFSIPIFSQTNYALVTFLPVFDIEKKVSGFIVGVEQADFLETIHANFIKNITLTLISSLLVLLLLFGYFKERYLLQKLVDSKESLEHKVKQRTLALHRNAKLLKTMLETIPTPVFYKNLEGEYLGCNKAFAKLAGKEPEQIVGFKSKDIFNDEITKKFVLSYKKALSKKETVISETKFSFPDGKEHHLVIHKSILMEKDTPVGLIGVIHDITKQKKSQLKLKEAFNKIKLQQEILESDHDIIKKYTIFTKMNLKFEIIEVSDGLCNLLGYSEKEILGKRHFEIVGKKEDDELFVKARNAILEGKAFNGEFLAYGADGNKIWVRTVISPEYNDKNELIGYVTFSQDISREKMILEHSYKDELTKLYNRKKFNEELEHALSFYARYKDATSLILFDIDKFKEINDIYGHLIGDKILMELAAIVAENIRECDILARWGGEEFALILPKTNIEQAISTAKKLREKIISYDFEIPQGVTCSFGVTVFQDKDTTDSLIKRVDDMLYRAKKEGRDKIIFDAMQKH